LLYAKNVLSLSKIYFMRSTINTISALFVCAFLFIGTIEVSAQTALQKGYNFISEDTARDIVYTLADDSFEGRAAGLEGGEKAAAYIASLLKKWGVKPLLSSGYFQEFAAAKNQSNWITESDMPLDDLIVAGCETRTMKNVLACIPGNSEECVIVGAHYDHLGIGSAVDGDSCYNGADDNASGVAAVLQLAKAFKESKQKPERTIIFAFWDGEEKGLLGSRYFVKKHPFIENIAAYMNFDMIGRGPIENPGHLSYLYTAANPLFGEWLRADAARYEFCFTPLYKASENLLSGSDNAPFARVGIPIVWYHTEGHPDYHRPSDTADKVDYPKLFDITRAAYLCAWRLANEVGY
jgi:hypothetical protein